MDEPTIRTPSASRGKRLLAKRKRNYSLRSSKRIRSQPIIIESPETIRINSPEPSEFDLPELVPRNEHRAEMNCRKKAENKVNDFFNSITVLSSDDEDEVSKPKETKTANVPTCSQAREKSSDDAVILVEDGSGNMPSTSSTSANSFEKDCDDVLLLADSILTEGSTDIVPPLDDMKSLIDFRKETEELIKTASSMIDKFKDSKLNKDQPETTTKVPESPKGPLCPVCLDAISSKPSVSTVCGHVFCKECITRAIKELKKCPTCRKTLNHKKYHPIYL